MNVCLDIIARTVSRYLSENRLHGYIAVWKPYLRRRNVDLRLQWAQKQLLLTLTGWTMWFRLMNCPKLH